MFRLRWTSGSCISTEQRYRSGTYRRGLQPARWKQWWSSFLQKSKQNCNTVEVEVWFCRKVGGKRNGQAAKLHTLYVLIQSALRIVTVGMAMVCALTSANVPRTGCVRAGNLRRVQRCYAALTDCWLKSNFMLAGPWSHTPRGMVGIRKSRWFDNGGWARDLQDLPENHFGERSIPA